MRFYTIFNLAIAVAYVWGTVWLLTSPDRYPTWFQDTLAKANAAQGTPGLLSLPGRPVTIPYLDTFLRVWVSFFEECMTNKINLVVVYEIVALFFVTQVFVSVEGGKFRKGAASWWRTWSLANIVPGLPAAMSLFLVAQESGAAMGPANRKYTSVSQALALLFIWPTATLGMLAWFFWPTNPVEPLTSPYWVFLTAAGTLMGFLAPFITPSSSTRDSLWARLLVIITYAFLAGLNMFFFSYLREWVWPDIITLVNAFGGGLGAVIPSLLANARPWFANYYNLLACHWFFFPLFAFVWHETNFWVFLAIEILALPPAPSTAFALFFAWRECRDLVATFGPGAGARAKAKKTL